MTPEPTTATRPIRLGLHIQPAHADFADIRAAVVRAEEMGVDAIFTWDHFFPFFGDPDGKSYECWTMLATWAEVTSTVEIGTLVSSVGYRNADLLANMARTVDHASGGRLVLGLGAGSSEKDHVEYGYEFGTGGSRLEQLRAALPRVRARLDALNPPPVRRVPFLIGGGGEAKTLRMAAEHADIWHGYGPPPVIARKNQVLDRHCGDIGRAPAEIERACGAQPQAIEDADRLVEAGVSLITFGFHGGTGYDFSPVADWVAWRDERNAALATA